MQFRLRKTRGTNDSQKTNTAIAATSLAATGVAGSTSQADILSGHRVQVRWQWLVVPALVFSDVLLALVVWGFAFTLHDALGRGPLSEVAATSIITNLLVWTGMRALVGLYPGYGLGQAEELRRQTYAVLATLATTAIFALAFQVGDLLSRLLLGLGFLGLLFLAPVLRYFVKWGMMRAGLWGKSVVILGADKTGAHLARALQREWDLGFSPVAVFDDRLAPVGGVLENVPYGGTLIDAINLPRKQGIDTAIFAIPHAHRNYLAEFVGRASLRFRYLIVTPNLAGVATSAVVARDLSGILGVEIKHNLLNPWTRGAKRALDLFGVVVGGVLISPLLLAIIVLIKLNSPGPAFYSQQRLGSGGQHFRCWKFRTMRSDAEWSLTKLLQSNTELRSEWERDQKLRNDPRISRVGSLLRKTSLDELPQLWNVLRGEMSLVGPRPIIDVEVPKYGEAYELYQRVTPGITGLWQVSGRNDTGYEERVSLDIYYVRNWSIWLDLVILVRTLGSVVSSRGAF